MSMHEYGYHGATRQSWQAAASMKELCLRIIDEHPEAKKNEQLLAKLFKERAGEDDEFLSAAVHHAVANTFNSLIKAAYRAQPRPAAAEQKAEMVARAEALAAAVTQAILLNQIMPNGKKMRFCTGTEMSQMGSAGAKECAAWIKIGKKVGNKRVGEVLNEKQVKAFLT